MKFTLTTKLLSLNAYRNNHYRKNNNEKHDFLLMMLPICQKLKPITGTIGVRYDYVCKSKRRRDLDNLVVNRKYINDALVHYGIIEEDNLSVITESIERGYTGAKESYINVTIYESNPTETPKRIE